MRYKYCRGYFVTIPSKLPDVYNSLFSDSAGINLLLPTGLTAATARNVVLPYLVFVTGTHHWAITSHPAGHFNEKILQPFIGN